MLIVNIIKKTMLGLHEVKGRLEMKRARKWLKVDKKKKKAGRAKRRIQYNRRFVNVVGGAFGKKGPNSLAVQQARAGITPDKA